MNTILWFVGKAFELTFVFVGLWIFFYICRHGTGAVKELIRTVGELIKALCYKINDKLTEKKPAKEPEVKEQTYEVHLTAKELEAFDKMVHDKGTSTV